MSWSDYKTSVFNLWYRLHWRILHGSLPIWLQIKWLVQLEPLQLFLWDRDESQIQMAEGEALQWRSPLPEAGSQESGEYVKSPTEISLCLLQFQLGSLGSKLALQLQTRVISWLWLWVSWAILELLEDWGEDAHVTAERDLNFLCKNNFYLPEHRKLWTNNLTWMVCKYQKAQMSWMF